MSGVNRTELNSTALNASCPPKPVYYVSFECDLEGKERGDGCVIPILIGKGDSDLVLIAV